MTMTRSILAFTLSIDIGACSAAPPPVAADVAPAAEHLPGGISIQPFPDNSTVSTDQSGHGAVLCAWLIYVDVQYVGKTCFPEETQTQSLLSGEIARIDRFIMENAPATRAQLEQRKATELSAAALGKQQCGGERSKWFEELFKAMQAAPQKLRASVDDLLSVPRQPVMDPCL